MAEPDPAAGGTIEPPLHETVGGGRWASSRLRPVPVAGLLPLRIFLGVTYLYAGIDKLVSPHFLVSGDPFSVAVQMEGYARSSPLAPLIEAALPAAVQVGLLIALAELAIGLGVLTGLSYRLSAASGVALSLLFWLTASWSTTPYFFSPDLPYAFGFLTLAVVGHGGLLVVGVARERATAVAPAVTGPGDPTGPAVPPSAGRRSVLALGLLAALTLVTAGVAASLRLLGSGGASGGGAAAGATPEPSATAARATASPAATAAPSTPAPSAEATGVPPATVPPATAPPTPATTAVAGPVVGSLADFDTRNGLPFQVPFEAAGNLNPGGPGIMVKLGDGSVVAYGAVCTHGRCTVGWDAATGIIQCPCHTARFDPANNAAVLSGPAPSPLTAIPVAVDEAGRIHVTAVR